MRTDRRGARDKDFTQITLNMIFLGITHAAQRKHRGVACLKPGLCAHCHSGSLLNQTNEFAPLFIQAPIPTASRFVDILGSGFNKAGNKVREFVFDEGTPAEFRRSRRLWRAAPPDQSAGREDSLDPPPAGGYP